MRRWSFSAISKLFDYLKCNSRSSSGTGNNPLRRSWKTHFIDCSWAHELHWLLTCSWARCQKAIGGIYFKKKWRAGTQQPGLEFDNFKPRLKSGIFKCISWLNGSFFWGDALGSLKDQLGQDLSNGISVPMSNFRILTVGGLGFLYSLVTTGQQQ